MYIADLHIHSKYSRATSRECVPEYLDLWARRKGIDLLGTGDFTHPAWRRELKDKLAPAEDGLYHAERRLQNKGFHDSRMKRNPVLWYPARSAPFIRKTARPERSTT